MEAQTAPPLALRFVTDLAGVEALAADWRRLESSCSSDEAVAFQAFDWCRTVIRLRLEHGDRRFAPLIAVLEADTETVGIWPLGLFRVGGLRILRALDEPFGQLAGVLCMHRPQVGEFVRLTLEAVHREGLADVISIANVGTDTALHAALAICGAKGADPKAFIRIDMRGCPTFDAYLARLKPKSRKNWRHARNRMARLGPVSHAVIEEPEQLASLMRETFDGRLAWALHNGKSTPAFRDPLFRPLVEHLAGEPAHRLIGFRLELAGETIATQWGLVAPDRYYAYLSARNPAYDGISPGRTHFGFVAAACLARGIRQIELMTPGGRDKTMWSRQQTAVEEMWLALSARGRVAWLARRTAVPVVRRLTRALPPVVRRLLAAHVNRSSRSRGTLRTQDCAVPHGHSAQESSE